MYQDVCCIIEEEKRVRLRKTNIWNFCYYVYSRLKTELTQIEKQVRLNRCVAISKLTRGIQIYELETSYLEETKDFGNVFTGWEAFISSEKTKPRKAVVNEDRHFSLSSVTSPVSRKEENKKVRLYCC